MIYMKKNHFTSIVLSSCSFICKEKKNTVYDFFRTSFAFTNVLFANGKTRYCISFNLSRIKCNQF